MLPQTRSDHCIELAHYRNRIDPTKSAVYPRCEVANETVNKSTGSDALLQSEQEKGSLENPKEVLAYAEETLQSNASDA